MIASKLQSTVSSDTSTITISKTDPSCLHIIVYNESKKISVKKIDGETNKEINGATFKIKDEQGNYLKFNKVNDSYMYSSTGKIDTLYDASKSSYTISALPTGKYYVEETNVPYPYILSGTQKERQTAFKIDSKNYLTVYNYTKKAYEKSPDASVTIKNYTTKIELVKKGKKNAKLPYVEFELYNSDKTKQITVTKTGDGIYTYPENGTGTPIKLITGSLGKITIYNLPVGKYNMREVKAADMIFGILPDDQRDNFRNLWEEFEKGETPEAKFAHTMDNFQPAMLNDLTEGKSWVEKGVHLSQILERNKNTAAGSKEIWDYAYKNIFEKNVEAGKIKKDN